MGREMTERNETEAAKGEAPNICTSHYDNYLLVLA